MNNKIIDLKKDIDTMLDKITKIHKDFNNNNDVIDLDTLLDLNNNIECLKISFKDLQPKIKKEIRKHYD